MWVKLLASSTKGLCETKHIKPFIHIVLISICIILPAIPER
jgi:hypothetical protein